MSNPNIKVSINVGGQQVIGAESRPYNKFPAYDFSDGFYKKNGINPDKIVDRLVGQEEDPRRSIPYASPLPDFADVRIQEITGGFNHLGSLLYYTVPGKINPDTFTNDAAGKKAIPIANEFRAFLFPKKDGDPLSPAAPNRRQDNLFDTRNQYFRRNPLGLWHATFVSYTDKADKDSYCQKALEELKEKNGVDLDGTPVLKTLKEIDHLVHLGCAELRHRASDGSQGFPWII